MNIGKTVKFAVLSQRLDELEKLGKYKIKEVLSRYKPSYIVDGKETTPGQMMERLGFESAQLMTPIKDLSGGQKRRMQLLLILLDEPNVLIMDEPGNDLDTDMLAVMEDLLDTWPGTLIVVSHDRYLLERVTDQQFALIGGKIRHLPGGVQDYLDMTEAIKNGKDPFADEKSGKNDKTRKNGDAGDSATTWPTVGNAGNSAGDLPLAIRRRLPRRSSPARRSTRHPSALLRLNASWPSWRNRRPIWKRRWPRTTQAITRVWASSTSSCRPSRTSLNPSKWNGWSSPNSSSSPSRTN